MRKKRKPVFYIGFAVLFALYIAAVIITPRISRSQELLIIGRTRLPVSAFAGVLSSVANICIVCVVVFYHIEGFYAALGILVAQIPYWIYTSISQHSLSSIPGLFSSGLTIIVILMIHSRDRKIEQYRMDEVRQLTDRQKISEHLFEQTATALVTAIDAKDEYSHGHSVRVAEYAMRIAQNMGKSEEECKMVYYAGLLHDVGKIGIPDAIINKQDELSPEEYEEIKKHPVLGNQILSSIRDYPYISIGAHYHHERYDGKGYPDGLKGEDIPEIARIISVADAYDVMSSNRSYRRAIPQQIIREEIIAGAGTQFDPEIAQVMRRMIDSDAGYRMKEREPVKELAGNSGMHCGAYRSWTSEGIILWKKVVKIHLSWIKDDPKDDRSSPALILFDSLDTRVHEDEKTRRDLNYFEYCEIRPDGKTAEHGVRAVNTVIREVSPALQQEQVVPGLSVYDIEAAKCKDHVLIRISSGRVCAEVTVALPDSSRFAYLALTGENGTLSDVCIEEGAAVPDGYIPRIAKEISYIRGPAGDIPNVQVDSIRSASSESVAVEDGLQMTFHAMSLPTARLIWHCPYVLLFHSEDGKVHGKGYTEYAAVRLDGESWENDSGAENRVIVNRGERFGGWDAWKRGNREGYNCTVRFTREGERITVSSENLGLSVKCITVLPAEAAANNETIYTALTGDQCALTNIRFLRP